MGKIFRIIVWVAAIAGVLIGALRLVAIRWWRVPTDDPVLEASLAPTLRGGDWVLLWRVTEPSFGSLVVCPDPDNPGRYVIGRLAGEMNDRVTVDGDEVEVNDHAIRTETVCTEQKFTMIDPETHSEIQQGCDLESMGGVVHMRGTSAGFSRTPVVTTRTVGAGNIFLVSDNRMFPYDSRNYGSIERKLCKESVFFRLIGSKGFMDVQSRLTYIR